MTLTEFQEMNASLKPPSPSWIDPGTSGWGDWRDHVNWEDLMILFEEDPKLLLECQYGSADPTI